MSERSLQRPAGEVSEPQGAGQAAIEQTRAPVKSLFAKGCLHAHVIGVPPCNLAAVRREVNGGMAVEELDVPPFEIFLGLGHSVMHQVVQPPETEAAGAEEAVDVAEEGLAGVNRVEHDLDLERAHRAQAALGSLENAELGALGVELDVVNRPDSRLLGPVVERPEIDER